MSSPSSTNDRILLIKLRDGSEKAFDYFYQKYSLQIYRKIYKMTRVPAMSEELLQDVFVRIWDKRHLIDPDKPFKSYLYQIAQNIIYDFYRKVAREERLKNEIKAIFDEAENFTEDGINLKDTKQILSHAIENLPPQQKLVFTLCKIEGKTYDEVSTSLGISNSTINGHIVKATKSIKSFMFKYEDVAFLLFFVQLFGDI
ncbi:MAG TPA: RNA polymerase sigma-70 factor [Sphingobacteriaceae bacterium]